MKMHGHPDKGCSKEPNKKTPTPSQHVAAKAGFKMKGDTGKGKKTQVK